MDLRPSIPYAVPATILGIALILMACIASRSFYAVKSLSNTISVTGSAQQVITSDVAKWNVMLTRTVDIAALQEGSNQIADDLAALKAFLKKNGVEDTAIKIAPVNVNTLSGKNNDYSTPSSYQLMQTVEVTGKDVEKLTKIAQDSSSLLAQGTMVSTMSLEYFYSKLADLKVQMLAEATKNAQERARNIAESAGANLGPIRSADMGVMQVTAENSIDVSDYGVFDTSSIRKQITAVVRATFAVE